MTFHQATRQKVKALIGHFGKSGSGKTLSGLFLARGLAGLSGKVGVIDTENGRASLFSDMLPGGYLVLDLGSPFSPDAYSKALDEAESAGIEALLIDSMSHEWTGEGGYLDMKEAALSRMAGDDWKKREACGMAASAQCKPKHNKFIAKLLRSPMHLILCFRAHPKVRLTKEAGKTKITTDDFASPIQDSGLIFEMLISAEVVRIDGKPGCMRLDLNDPQTKWTHPDLLEVLPKDGQQITIQNGESIAAWLSVGATSKPQAKALKTKLWNMARETFSDNVQEFETSLRSSSIITPEESLASLSVDRLIEVIEKVGSTL